MNIRTLALVTTWLLTSGCLQLFVPRFPFDPALSPPPPDYADRSAWAALPDRDDQADRVPVGESDGQTNAVADVFFVHPTTLFDRKVWNQPLDDADTNARTDRVMANQASAFNAAGRVFAPRYRQATLGYAITDDTDSADGAFALAYTDVRAAFEHYLEHFDTGRPLILASHSQGSQHMTHLIADRVTGTPLQERLVAAYIIGAPIPTDWSERVAPDVPACTGPTDTGCLVSWQTVEDGTHTVMDFDGRSRAWFPDGYESLEGRSTVCLNPLTFTSDAGTRSDHAGAVSFEEDGQPEPSVGIVAGTCRDGLLQIERPDERAFVARGGDYHIHDYSLFYMDLRANAVDRVEAFTTP